jgi:hypothetical protein
MFVRFRATYRHRLDLSLLQAVRRDDKPGQEHIASLGSIPHPATVADRVKYWRNLHERLAKLGNRLDAETQARIMDDIHARIPMPTTHKADVIVDQLDDNVFVSDA